MSKFRFKRIGRVSKEVKKEFSSLYFAWREFMRLHIYRVTYRKKAIINSILVFICLGVVCWLARTVVYAQSDQLIKNAAYSSVFAKAAFWIFGGGLLGVFTQNMRKKYDALKRFFDLVISIISLIVFSPLFLIVALLVKIDSPGPVFFKQERIGEGGKLFNILKFRTMRKNAELETGPVWAQDEDPRITKIGNFLRKSHLDEIPQLINVFLGDMALIGPRPERPEMTDIIKKDIPNFDQRLNIKPGVTGLAQSRYNYGATIKDASRKLQYDLIYIKRMCFLLDIQIIFWTAGKVLTGEGSR